MQLIKLKCENCSSQLEIDLDNLKAFCPYCGQKLMISFEQMGDILKEKEISKRRYYSEDHKTKRVQLAYGNEEKARKTKKQKLFVALIIGALVLLSPILFAVYYTRYVDNKRAKGRQEALSLLYSIEAEMESAFMAGDYDTSLMKAHQLQYDYIYPEEKEVWDEKREAYIEQILQKKKEQEINDPNNIFVGIDSDKLTGEDYEEVVALFKGMGFTNVSVQVSPEKPSLFQGNKTVEHILIGGQVTFTAADYFPKDTVIIVYYYSR